MIDNRDYPPNPNAPFNSSFHLARATEVLRLALLKGVPETEYLKDYHAIMSEVTELSHEVIRCRGYRAVSGLLLNMEQL